MGRHKNIMNMIACCTKMGPFMLVVEYVPNGDLLQYLRIIRTQVRLITPDVTTCQPNTLFNQLLIDQLFNRSIDRLSCQSTHQSANQPTIIQSINQLINHTIRQSFNYLINRSINQSINQSISQPISYIN